jgi:hypothetical protein
MFKLVYLSETSLQSTLSNPDSLVHPAYCRFVKYSLIA